MSNKTYDTLKWIAQVLIPALSTLYVALGTIWGWPYLEAVAGSLAAIDTFMGVLLGVSSINYQKTNNTGGSQAIEK
ncbi:MAG TPA: phage holin [Lachnospiraceae bacterium]|jgi:sorbitol-specific phosphotransferase system component IIBC|nr:phage holin [Lachnospiraceae bacterium]